MRHYTHHAARVDYDVVGCFTGVSSSGIRAVLQSGVRNSPAGASADQTGEIQGLLVVFG